MSNEEVVLQMLVNRLEQLLNEHSELQQKWSAELTEIILLGKGVLKSSQFEQAVSGDLTGDMDQIMVRLEFNLNELDCLSDIMTGNTRREDWIPIPIDSLAVKLERAYDEVMVRRSVAQPEVDPGDPDEAPEPDDDDEAPEPDDANAGMAFSLTPEQVARINQSIAELERAYDAIAEADRHE